MRVKKNNPEESGQKKREPQAPKGESGSLFLHKQRDRRIRLYGSFGDCRGSWKNLQSAVLMVCFIRKSVITQTAERKKAGAVLYRRPTMITRIRMSGSM